MEISVDILTDPSGFIRRECPTCMDQFKWFVGATDERPDDFVDPDAYFCPFCGVPADKDSWWTQEQLAHAQNVAIGAALKHAQGELAREFGRGKARSSFRLTPSKDVPRPPDPLTDPDDMVMVASPCHSFEPIKVNEERLGSVLRCLVCGSEFTV